METGANTQPLSLQANSSQTASPVPLSYVVDLPEPDEEELDLGQLFAVIRRRAFVIIGMAVAVTTGVGYWTSEQEPKYEGTFQLLVEPVTDEGNKLSSRLAAVAGSLGAGFLGGQGGGLDYASQLAVLKSPEKMEPIVQQLQVKYPEIEYNSIVGGAEGPLIMERHNDGPKIIQVRYRDEDPEKIEFVLQKLKEGYLRYSIEDRKTNIGQGLQFIEDQRPQLQRRVDALQEKLQQFRQKYNLIDPETKGAKLADQFTRIQDQLIETESSLVQQQRLYQTLRSQVGMEPNAAISVSVLSEAPSYQRRLQELKDIENRIVSESTRFTANTPQMQLLFQQRQELQALLRQEAAQVLGRNGAGVIGTQQEPYQSSVRLSLIQQMVNTDSQIEVLKVRRDALGQVAGLFQQQLDQFPRIVREYTDLQLELQIATKTLNELLVQRETLRLEASQKEIPWEVIAEPKIPRDEDGNPVPYSPNMLRNLVLGAMLGLMLGFGAALLAERLDNHFHTVEDLKDTTRLPLLGIIPFSYSAKKLASATWIADSDTDAEFLHKRDTVFLEAIRDLNAKMQFLNADKPIRSLAIASATAAEGKSTVAVHLAQAAAEMGKRVLLVDADLRWPQVHDRLGIINRKGLTNVLAAKLDWREAIQISPVDKNLSILTAGALPRDPIKLLSSRQMRDLMQDWLKEFELIIYDTPPLLNVVDGRMLGSMTDGIALVANIRNTERDSILEALDELQASRLKVLGIIANSVKGNSVGWYDDRPRFLHNKNSDRETLEEDAIL
ncbi:MAG: polysaccharide biosynthesis tyrosine autokinase [Oscillatoria sp. SIO1A7]|nr:polysaccharide biosynthesis tyrosine autokinase [Oscillatoria sp. SIO1A7]